MPCARSHSAKTERKKNENTAFEFVYFLAENTAFEFKFEMCTFQPSPNKTYVYFSALSQQNVRFDFNLIIFPIFRLFPIFRYAFELRIISSSFGTYGRMGCACELVKRFRMVPVRHSCDK